MKVFGLGVLMPNNTLQGTFDLLAIFAIAKTSITSNAPERGR